MTRSLRCPALAAALAAFACSPAQLRFPADFAAQSDRQSLSVKDGAVDVGGYKIHKVALDERWDLASIDPFVSKQREASWFGFELVGSEKPWEGQCVSIWVRSASVVSDEQKLRLVCRFQERGSAVASDLEITGEKELESGTATLRVTGAGSRSVRVLPHVDASGSSWVNVPAARHAGYRVDEGERTLGAIQLSSPDATWLRKGLGAFRVPVAISLAVIFLFEAPAAS